MCASQYLSGMQATDPNKLRLIQSNPEQFAQMLNAAQQAAAAGVPAPAAPAAAPLPFGNAAPAPGCGGGGGGGMPPGLQQMLANPQMMENIMQNPEMLQQLLQVPEVRTRPPPRRETARIALPRQVAHPASGSHPQRPPLSSRAPRRPCGSSWYRCSRCCSRRR